MTARTLSTRAAREYRTRRRNGVRASQAILIARNIDAQSAFAFRLSELSRSEAHGDYRVDDLAELQMLESHTGRLRVEIATMYDSERHDVDESDTLDSLVAFFRKSKYGKAQALDAAREQLESIADYQRKRESGFFTYYGVSAAVYFDGELIAEDSCWGYESDGGDVEDFKSEIARNALYTAVPLIRAQARAERRFVAGWTAALGYGPLPEITSAHA